MFVYLDESQLNSEAMKKIIFSLVVVAAFLLFACKKDDHSNTKTVQLNQPFTLVVDQTAVLDSDGMRIKLLGITEDSRCPTNANCFWAGRVVAEFEVVKDAETVIRTLTDNPANDATLSTSFTAFGHLVMLEEVTPYPAGSPIAQKDYVVKITVE